MVMAHGSNDEYYKFSRDKLEELIRSGQRHAEIGMR